MTGGLAARWLLTAVFAAAGLRAVLPRREPPGSAQPADLIPAVRARGLNTQAQPVRQDNFCGRR
jgi:hypothetical protein